MDKARILPFLCGLLCTPAFGQLTTVGPNTPGVTESIMTLTPSPTSSDPDFALPVFTPHLNGSPTGDVAISGDSTFPFPPDTGCLEGCDMGEPGFFRALEVSFATPVSLVDVMQLQAAFNLGAVFAYNAAGQLVGACEDSWPIQGINGPGSCYQLLSITSTGGLTSFTIQAPGIVTVLAGGYLDNDSIDVPAVSFAPTAAAEPGTLILMALGLAGVGFMRRRKPG